MPLQNVGDVDLHFEIIDYTEPWKYGATPVVLIHGLGGDRDNFFYQVPAFCSRFATVTVDLRGHGRSTRPGKPFGMAEMASDVARLLRAQGIERAHILGVSLGGMVAQQLALDQPYEVASLVLVDTLSGIPPEFTEVARASLQFVEDNPMEVVARERITNAFSDAVDPALRDHVIDRIRRNHKESYLHAAGAAFSFSVTDRLPSLRVPTLVVVGDQDRVTPPILSEQIAAAIPDARLEHIAGAGHISNMERPHEFNTIVLDFLGSLGG